MLARNGYCVLSADSGENAIRLFKNNPDTDLLLTDVVAPGMSGPMIADQISCPQAEYQGIVYVWLRWGQRVVQHYVIEKGYSLLTKPFTIEQLEHKVRGVLSEGGQKAGA